MKYSCALLTKPCTLVGGYICLKERKPFSFICTRLHMGQWKPWIYLSASWNVLLGI